jgi:hypothetical protein
MKYRAGGRLLHRQSAVVLRQREVVIPDDFEKQYAEFCCEANLDPDDEDSIEEFVGQGVYEWYADQWEQVDWDIQAEDWQPI